MNIDIGHSKNMHKHTERGNAVFTKNSLKEIITRYQFAERHVLNKNILEIGPGTGFGSKNIINKSRDYTCIEYSIENINQLEKNYSDIKIINNDYTNLDKEELKKLGTFDCIVSMANIYYFDFKKFVYISHKLLNPSGKIIFCTTNKLHHSFIKSDFTKEYYSVSELEEILIRNGFKVEFYGSFTSRKNSLNSFLLSIIKGLINFFIPKKYITKIKKSFKLLIDLPENLSEVNIIPEKLEEIESNEESKNFLVIYCIAEKVI